MQMERNQLSVHQKEQFVSLSMNSKRLPHSFFRNAHFSSPERFCVLAENKFQ